MTARILVVDDVPANLKFLEARLSAEYFDVRTASSGPAALRLCAQTVFDVVLIDVMMPGVDGFEVCRRLKADETTAHVPVILVTALDQAADRVRGLEAGADDFLTKPVDELSLIARVRSLARLKLVVDELRRRAEQSASLGLQPHGLAGLSGDDPGRGRILLVEDRAGAGERIAAALGQAHEVALEPDAGEALFRAVSGDFDLVVVSSSLQDQDPLRICSQLRSLERSRDLPLLLLADPGERDRIIRGLAIGVNAYLVRPGARTALAARVRTQLRRKRYTDRLRQVMAESLQLAVIDPLTGLHNRRYLDTQLATLVEASANADKALSLMILDIDHFKSVNDTHGHQAGDEILKGFANRVRGIVRRGDLLCRLGGEEFILVMPDTDLDMAGRIGERVRETVGSAPFPVAADGASIPVTVSIGIADRRGSRDVEVLMKRADRALYRSKALGRNRVCADAA